MFTLEQNIFIVQCYFRNGERLEKGEWSYSTLRVFEEFQQKFPDFQHTYQQLAQKDYKCVNMFLETGSVLRKKGSRRPTKRTAEILKRFFLHYQRKAWYFFLPLRNYLFYFIPCQISKLYVISLNPGKRKKRPDAG
jgi:hypothetical protein